MILFKIISFTAFFLHFANGINPTPIFSELWSQLNPISMENNIKTIVNEVREIKTHLQKIEIATIFGQDVKQIEYLIESYIDVVNKNDSAQGDWADTATEFGGDGFRKTLTSLKEMMDGSSTLFAQDSIFEVIVNK